MPSLLLAGGMISFDVFPEGWDKRYCLNVLDDERFDTIHFFGNETTPVSMPHSPHTWPLSRVAGERCSQVMPVCSRLVMAAGLLGRGKITLD